MSLVGLMRGIGPVRGDGMPFEARIIETCCRVLIHQSYADHVKTNEGLSFDGLANNKSLRMIVEWLGLSG